MTTKDVEELISQITSGEGNAMRDADVSAWKKAVLSLARDLVKARQQLCGCCLRTADDPGEPYDRDMK